jgi:XTP/dITP diphosphohydrolase
MKKVLIASRNAGKIAEIEAMYQQLPLEIHSLSEFTGVPDAEETGATFAQNALLKAQHYVHHTGMACMADDSGLEVDILGGAPGVYSARFAGENASDEDNNRKLISLLVDTPAKYCTARFRCALAFLDSNGTVMTATGICEGQILKTQQGSGGFGYDPLFFMPGLGATLSEISLTEKNRISHRGEALRAMAEKLAVYLK